MKYRIALLLLGCTLFYGAIECYAAPAAPYTLEALKKLNATLQAENVVLYSIMNGSNPPTDAAEKAKIFIKHYKTIYQKAGYDLDKSIIKFIKDTNTGVNVPANTSAISTQMVISQLTGEIDFLPKYYHKYFSKEATAALDTVMDNISRINKQNKIKKDLEEKESQYKAMQRQMEGLPGKYLYDTLQYGRPEEGRVISGFEIVQASVKGDIIFTGFNHKLTKVSFTREIIEKDILCNFKDVQAHVSNLGALFEEDDCKMVIKSDGNSLDVEQTGSCKRFCKEGGTMNSIGGYGGYRTEDKERYEWFLHIEDHYPVR